MQYSVVNWCCSELCCKLVLVIVASGTEIWCGQGQGKIVIWNLNSSGGGLHSLYHYETDSQQLSSSDVVHLVSSHVTSNPTVWSYIYPGKSFHKRYDVLCLVVYLPW